MNIILFKNKYGTYPIKVSYGTITSSECKKLLDIKIDQELQFNEHVQSFCQKATRNRKSRVASIMKLKQGRLFTSAFIFSHF